MFKHWIICLTFSFSFGFRKNILLIVSDDLRPALGCYGDKNAHTPHIDLFSSESVLFLNAYAQQALCAPSRNSFLTSRRPDTLHLYDFYSYWRNFAGNFTTLPQYFKQQGYYTKSIGKIFHPGKSSNFSDDQPYSWSCPPYHPSTEIYKEAAVCGVTRQQRALVCPVAPRLQPGGTLPDLQSLQEARAFLRAQAKEQKPMDTDYQPFLLAVGFHKPHIPLKYPFKYLGYHPLSKVRVPQDSWPAQMPSVAWNPWTDVRSRDDIAALNISFPFGHMPENWSRLIRQSYYAAVSYIDDLFGKLLHELRTAGLYKNTIVVLLGDHGWSLGEHGEWSKFSNFEAAVRVPLLLRIPGLTDSFRVQQHSSSLVELLDLFPTLVDAAGLPPLPVCPRDSSNITLCTQGSSLVPLIYSTLVKNLTEKWSGKTALSQYPRPSVYPSQYPNSDKPHLRDIHYMGYSLRTRQYRYTEWPFWQSESMTPLWDNLAGMELYDHSIDPKEDMNLAGRPGFEHIQRELQTKLRLKVGL